jgi:hypothetical protein
MGWGVTPTDRYNQQDDGGNGVDEDDEDGVEDDEDDDGDNVEDEDDDGDNVEDEDDDGDNVEDEDDDGGSVDDEDDDGESVDDDTKELIRRESESAGAGAGAGLLGDDDESSKLVENFGALDLTTGDSGGRTRLQKKLRELRLPGSAEKKRIVKTSKRLLHEIHEDGKTEISLRPSGRQFVNLGNEYELFGRNILSAEKNQRIPGLYFICGCMEKLRDCQNCSFDERTSMKVKVGIAVDFVDRFTSYHTYFPRGFTILHLFAFVYKDDMGSDRLFDLENEEIYREVKFVLRRAEDDVLRALKSKEGITSMEEVVTKNRTEWLEFRRKFDEPVRVSIINELNEKSAGKRYQVGRKLGKFVQVCCEGPGKASIIDRAITRTHLRERQERRRELATKRALFEESRKEERQ